MVKGCRPLCASALFAALLPSLATASPSLAQQKEIESTVGFPLLTSPQSNPGSYGWRRESDHAGVTTWSQELPGMMTPMGARVFSRLLRMDNSSLEDLIVVFYNKGSTIPHRRAAANEAEIRRDFQALESFLTSALGRPSPAVESVSGVSESGRRWESGGYVFFLTRGNGEYVKLRVYPIHKKAATTSVRPVEIRNQAPERQVTRRPNGDIVLADFPMITQGDRGYCVPASWARLLNYMGCPTDMHTLAAASSATPAGTDIYRAANVATQAARSCARSVSSPKLRPTINEIARYIDRAQPLAWGMVFSPAFESTVARPAGSGPGQTLGVTTKQLDFRRGQPHMCIIVGYNRELEEVAVTDSWGQEYQERWYPLESLTKASLGVFYVVEQR